MLDKNHRPKTRSNAEYTRMALPAAAFGLAKGMTLFQVFTLLTSQLIVGSLAFFPSDTWNCNSVSFVPVYSITFVAREDDASTTVYVLALSWISWPWLLRFHAPLTLTHNTGNLSGCSIAIVSPVIQDPSSIANIAETSDPAWNTQNENTFVALEISRQSASPCPR